MFIWNIHNIASSYLYLKRSIVFNLFLTLNKSVNIYSFLFQECGNVVFIHLLPILQRCIQTFDNIAFEHLATWHSNFCATWRSKIWQRGIRISNTGTLRPSSQNWNKIYFGAKFESFLFLT